MPSTEIMAKVQSFAQSASFRADEFTGMFGSVKAQIVSQFGPNGLIAAYFVAAVLVLFIGAKLIKLTYSALKYLVVPSVGLAIVGSLILPLSFVMILPVTVTMCSLVLLFKG